MRLFVTGDTHGYMDMEKLAWFDVGNPELTKEDIMVVLGDCGVLWNDTDTYKKLTQIYNSFHFTTMFVGGNHENWDALDALPKARFHGGLCGEISDSLYHMRNGEIFDFNGTSVFVMGGAFSIDREWRVPHESWWPQEIPDVNARLYALENLLMYKNKVDYIFTHTPCSKTNRQMNAILGDSMYFSQKRDEYADWLNYLLHIDYKDWYCGHMHYDMTLQNNVHILYSDIKEIKI